MSFWTSRGRELTIDGLRWIILGLSIALIVFISIDTFKAVNFMEDAAYMRFQFWVCIVFILDFFIEFFLTPAAGRRRYVRRRWYYLMLSIPYLTVFHHLGIGLNHDVAYFLRFIPLARGALALAIVYDYLTRNVISTIFATYVSILLTFIYFGSLIFFEREMPVNESVTGFWDALWWGASQATTLGCDIYPVTVTGKIISVVLTAMGMVMFPLFTVYVTNIIVRRHGGTPQPTTPQPS